MTNDGVNTFVQANATGDLGADLRIQLNGVIALTAADSFLQQLRGWTTDN